MELRYRGTSYQAGNNYLNTVESGTTAQFLGRTYLIRQTNCPVVLKPNLYQYRGVVYGKTMFAK